MWMQTQIDRQSMQCVKTWCVFSGCRTYFSVLDMLVIPLAGFAAKRQGKAYQGTSNTQSILMQVEIKLKCLRWGLFCLGSVGLTPSGAVGAGLGWLCAGWGLGWAWAGFMFCSPPHRLVCSLRGLWTRCGPWQTPRTDVWLGVGAGLWQLWVAGTLFGPLFKTWEEEKKYSERKNKMNTSAALQALTWADERTNAEASILNIYRSRSQPRHSKLITLYTSSVDEPYISLFYLFTVWFLNHRVFRWSDPCSRIHTLNKTRGEHVLLKPIQRKFIYNRVPQFIVNYWRTERALIISQVGCYSFTSVAINKCREIQSKETTSFTSVIYLESSKQPNWISRLG